MYAPEKHFGVIGKSGVPRFAAAPDQPDTVQLADFTLPLSPERRALLPLLMDVKWLEPSGVGGAPCHVLEITPKPEALEALKLRQGQWRLWVRTNDSMPLGFGYRDGARLDVEVQLHNVEIGAPATDSVWRIPSREGDRIEVTAFRISCGSLPRR